MKKILLTLLLTLGMFGPAWAGSISKQDALKAIVVFEKSPSTKEGKAAASAITTFATESSEVTMTIGPDLIPWAGVDEKAPFYDQRATLLAAYFAGNVKSQLKQGKALDDPYSGLMQVVNTYQQLQQEDPAFKLAEVEKIKAMKENNQLREYLKRIAEKDKKKQ